MDQRAVKIIDQAGGDLKFAQLVGVDLNKSWKQLVCNWKRRGLPREVELTHYDTIKELEQKADSRPPLE